MASMNLHKRLPVIVVDHPEGTLSEHVENILNAPTGGRWSRFEVVRVSDIKQIGSIVEYHDIPRYAAVIYKASQVKGNIASIAKVRRHDPFVPQVIIGGTDNIEPSVLMQATRAGILEYAISIGEFAESYAKNVFKIQETPFPMPAAVFKIGGSALDFDRQVKGSRSLGECVEKLVELFRRRAPIEGQKKRTRPHRIICTVGAGQLGDVVKDYYRKYNDFEGATTFYPQLISEALSTNLRMLHGLFGSDNSSLINTGAFYFISKDSASKKVPLIGMAPHYVMVRDGIPMQDSDTHTIAIAEFYGIENVILIKRTDGIYRFDPMRGFRADPETGQCMNYAAWKEAQAANQRLGEVSLNNLFSSGISYEGTDAFGRADGTSGHLMEKSALKYMAGCNHVKRILVVHISPGEMYAPLKDGSELEHIVTGERMPLSTDWGQVRMGRLQAAFNNQSYSSIVRNNS